MSSWTHAVAQRVNEHLTAFFEEKRALAQRTSPVAPELLEALADLTMRGGKRLRPCALHAGFVAVDPQGEPAKTLNAAAALELLQTYLLIQDDWMDNDDERRGGPAVHVALGKAHGDAELGARLAMLAGDLASGFAWELLHRARFPEGRRDEGLAAFSDMHFEVVSGQQLDLLAHPDVARMHDLKSGSYTVRGPLRLGALLAGASPAQLDAITRFAQPIGVAFQLRDDLLGTFGDPRQTGKPIGNDLRVGKNTSLVAAVKDSLCESDRAPLQLVLDGGASDAEVETARQLIDSCGARAAVETRLDDLLNQARHVLSDAPFSDQGRQMLDELVDALVARSH